MANSEAMIVPEVLPPRGRPRRDSHYECPYMGAASCPANCPAMRGCPQLGQGMVSEFEGWLAETSPILGLAWGWIVLGGLVVLALFGKRK